jgi:hypothetical protein
MAQQHSIALRNNRANQVEATIGPSAILELRTGPQPANCAAADTGTLLALLTLPVDWLLAAVNGVLAKSGTWEDVSANGDGIAAHFRFKDSGGTTHIQGTVTLTGGGGDLTVSNVNFATGQAFTITSFSWTEPGV